MTIYYSPTDITLMRRCEDGTLEEVELKATLEWEHAIDKTIHIEPVTITFRAPMPLWFRLAMTRAWVDRWRQAFQELEAD